MDYEEIGRNIKRFRKGKMTQGELAEKIGKSASSVKKYELGLVEIPNRVIEEIAATLGVTARDLYGYDIGNKGVFERFLSELGYTVYRDDPEHKSFLVTDNGTYALDINDLESIRKSVCSYAKFTIEETLKDRPKMQKSAPA